MTEGLQGNKHIQAVFTSAIMTGKFEVLADQCHTDMWETMLLSIDIIIVILGLVANKTLLCLFLRERKSLPASQVLGVNLAVMAVIFLYAIFLSSLFANDVGPEIGRNQTFASWQNLRATYPLVFKIADGCSMLNLIGCPLLLTCMCIERCLAVMRPVLYLRVRRWENRMAVSAVVWSLTLISVLVTVFGHDQVVIMMSVSIVISCLFIVMLSCLVGVIWSLQQQSPALTTNTTKRSSESTQKRQAVGNVLIVVVPAIISYFPLLPVLPVILYISSSGHMGKNMCLVFELCFLFPRFGVFIGPLFYFSKARQACCLSGKGNSNV